MDLSEIAKVLPAGAIIENPVRHVVVADLDGDGKEEVVVFYVLTRGGEDRKPGIVVLRRDAGNYVRPRQKTYDSGVGFADPTGVRKLVRGPRPQVV